MFEDVHGDTGNAKTQHEELHDVPERLEVLALLLPHFLDTADKEEDCEEAVEDFEEDDDDGEAADVTL